MDYIEQAPSPELRPYVRSFIWIRNDNYISTESFRALADGGPGLIFQEYGHSFLGNEGEVLPQLFIHGINTRPTVKTAVSSYNSLVVCFQPHGLNSIFGINASELTNTYASLDQYFKTSLTEKLLEKSSFYDKVRLVSEFLTARIAGNKTDFIKIRFVLTMISSNPAFSTLKNLRTEMNISERSLERLMQSCAGVSPKQFLRISRFQSALNCLYNQPLSRLSDIAYSFNYSDQSHYIREFREFSGLSPKQFVRRSSPMQNFIAEGS